MLDGHHENSGLQIHSVGEIYPLTISQKGENKRFLWECLSGYKIKTIVFDCQDEKEIVWSDLELLAAEYHRSPIVLHAIRVAISNYSAKRGFSLPVLRDEDGNPDGLRPLPPYGYLVSTSGGEKLDRDLYGSLKRYAEQRAGRFAAEFCWFGDPDSILGGWFDEKRGEYHLDQNRFFFTEEEALEFAKENKQLAIWDIKENQEIRL